MHTAKKLDNIQNRYKKICRTCLKPAKVLTNIFHTEVKSVAISKMLIFATHVNIRSDDGHPDSICNTCLSKLIEVYAFQQMCIDSDLYYRRIITFKENESSTNILEDMRLEATEGIYNSDEEAEMDSEPDNSHLSIIENADIQNTKTEINTCTENDAKTAVLKIESEVEDSDFKIKENNSDSNSNVLHSRSKDIKILSNISTSTIISNTKNQGFAVNKPLSNAVASTSKSIPTPSSSSQCISSQNTILKTILSMSKTVNEITTPKTIAKVNVSDNEKELNQIKSQAYLCTFCRLSFSSIDRLRAHNMSDCLRKKPHSNTDQNSQVQGTSLRAQNVRHEESSGTLLTTMTASSQKKNYECNKCKRTFNAKNNFCMHLTDCRSATQNSKINSSAINQKNTSIEQNNLKMTKTPIGPTGTTEVYTCNFCKKVCSNHSDLNQHLNEHKVKLRYGTDTGSATSVHVSVNILTENSFKCNYCNNSFSTNEDLLRHSKEHKRNNLKGLSEPTEIESDEDQSDVIIISGTDEVPKSSDKNVRVCSRRKSSKTLPMINITDSSPEKCGTSSEANSKTDMLSKCMKGCECIFCRHEISIKMFSENYKRFIETGNLRKCDICKKMFYGIEVYENHKKLHKSTTKSPDIQPEDNQIEFVPVESNFEEKDTFITEDKEEENSLNVEKIAEAYASKNIDENMCDKCGLHLSTPSAILKHDLRWHSDKEPYFKFMCQFCGRGYKFKETMRVHKNKFHSSFKNTVSNSKNKAMDNNAQSVLLDHTICKYCDNNFQCLSGLQRHMRQVHRDKYKSYMLEKTENKIKEINENKLKSFKCNICTRDFDGSFALLQHMKMHKKTFSNENTTVNHKNKNHSPKLKTQVQASTVPQKNKMVSDEPNKKHEGELSSILPNTKALKGHILTAHPENKSNNSIKQTSTDRVHIEDKNSKETSHIQKTATIIECPICSLKIIKPDLLKSHLKKIHVKKRHILKENLVMDDKGEGVKFKCNLCAFLCNSYLSYLGHKNTSHRVAEKKIKSPNIYKKPEDKKSTNGENKSVLEPNKCLVCKKIFVTRFRLMKHMSIFHKEFIQMEKPTSDEYESNLLNSTNTEQICKPNGRKFSNSASVIHTKDIMKEDDRSKINQEPPAKKAKTIDPKCDLLNDNNSTALTDNSNLLNSMNTEQICKPNGRKFSNSANLKRHTSQKHMKNIMKEEERSEINQELSTTKAKTLHPRECELCGHIFSEVRSKEKHKIIHINGFKRSGNVIIFCTICKKFLREEHLNYHFENYHLFKDEIIKSGEFRKYLDIKYKIPLNDNSKLKKCSSRKSRLMSCPEKEISMENSENSSEVNSNFKRKRLKSWSDMELMGMSNSSEASSDDDEKKTSKELNHKNLNPKDK